MKVYKILIVAAVAATLWLIPGCKKVSMQDIFAKKGKKTQTTQASTNKTQRTLPGGSSLACKDRQLSYKDFDTKNPAWGKIWAACPASPVAGYNSAVQLMNQGDVDNAKQVASQAASMHPNFAPLQDLSQRLNDPYGYVGTLTDAKLKAWLATPSRHTFTQKPPTKATPPSLPKLVKGEFEKRATFEARVAAAKRQRAAQLRKIERDYERAVQSFNDAVARHNRAVEQERKERANAVPQKRAEYLEQAFSEVFGDPILTDPTYDSESEQFYARLISSSGLMSEKITVAVPLSEGKKFKQKVYSVRPVIPYEFKGGRLVRGAPQMKFGHRTYSAMFTDETFSPVVMTAMADVKVEPGKEISTMKVTGLDMSSVLKEDDAYFGGALEAQDNPQLAALKQKQAETNRQLREAQRQRAIDDEAKRIEEQIKRQQEELAALGGVGGRDYEGLTEKRKWIFTRARVTQPNTVAVVIGNRSYEKGIPLVHYAYNDAKAMRQFLVAGLGVPKENVLYREDATKGEMEGLFRRTLPNRVERGKTDVIVYFSGHGMPVDTKALLLPTDARPDTADITGYSRETMLTQLASLNAKSVTVILDACFSGTTKDGDALTVGKPVYKRPDSARLPQNTVLISASRANQISRMDEKSGMSLMTLYLLEGLSGKADGDKNGSVSVSELKVYLEKEVSRAAIRTYDMDQKPEVLGPSGRALVVY